MKDTTSLVKALVVNRTFNATGINKSSFANRLKIPKTTFLATIRGDANYHFSESLQRSIKKELLQIIKQLQALANKLPD